MYSWSFCGWSIPLTSKRVSMSSWWIVCLQCHEMNSFCRPCSHSVWRGSRWSLRQRERESSGLPGAGAGRRQPDEEHVLLRALREGLPQDVRPSDPHANPLGRETLPVLHVRQAVHAERSTQRSPEGPHGGEAVRLPGLREDLRPLGGHEPTPAHAHGGEAVPLLGVREELQPVGPLAGAREDPLRGEV